VRRISLSLSWPVVGGDMSISADVNNCLREAVIQLIGLRNVDNAYSHVTLAPLSS
jgi:hypothetical protein